MLVGSRCEFTCDKRLHHVFCNPLSSKCECQKNYPVKIGEFSLSSVSLVLLISLYDSFMWHNNEQVLAKAVQNVSLMDCCWILRDTRKWSDKGKNLIWDRNQYSSNS